MEVIEYHGVPMALVTPEEAVAGDWRAVADEVDVVRVERPPVELWPELRRRGFVVKPQFLSWIADVRASEEEYFAGLPKRERQKIRGGRRHLRAEGVAVETCSLDERLYDEFLVLYEDQIGSMRHGVAVARDERADVVAAAGTYSAICARRGRDLVGCCIAQRDEERDTLRVRFSAVGAGYRQDNLARVVYMQAAELARGLGHRWFSLGKDRNLYGHLAQPGLFRFKSHLGLVPHPSHLVDPTIGHDQADLVLRLGELTDPVLALGYVDERPSDRLRLHAYTYDPEPRLDPYEAGFLRGVTAHVLEREGQLVR
jgi:hypothetical protein